MGCLRIGGQGAALASQGVPRPTTLPGRGRLRLRAYGSWRGLWAASLLLESSDWFTVVHAPCCLTT